MDIEKLIERASLEGRVRANARHHERAGQPYRPSTGTEGIAFNERWCDLCARDAAFRDNPDSGDGCQIVADTFVYEITDPKYPKEWVFDRNHAYPV